MIGNYKIIKQIGEGGFSRIYQAEHVLLGEKACLKQNKNSTPEDAELLRNEAKLLWKLDDYHSIPSVKDFLELGKNNCAIVMSLIDGKTLADIVKDGSKHLAEEDACWVTERLLGALHYCHYHGVVHSDVKPENVFVEPQKHDIKLIDFGLGKYKPKSSTRPIGYTPRYAAPELLQGKPPVPETDLYGAGLVMLYALGGDVENKSFSNGTPKELIEYCNKLLRYNPVDRPNWDNSNPIKELSDIRHKLFGRRHSG